MPHTEKVAHALVLCQNAIDALASRQIHTVNCRELRVWSARPHLATPMLGRLLRLVVLRNCVER